MAEVAEVLSSNRLLSWMGKFDWDEEPRFTEKKPNFTFFTLKPEVFDLDEEELYMILGVRPNRHRAKIKYKCREEKVSRQEVYKQRLNENYRITPAEAKSADMAEKMAVVQELFKRRLMENYRITPDEARSADLAGKWAAGEQKKLSPGQILYLQDKTQPQLFKWLMASDAERLKMDKQARRACDEKKRIDADVVFERVHRLHLKLFTEDGEVNEKDIESVLSSYDRATGKSPIKGVLYNRRAAHVA